MIRNAGNYEVKPIAGTSTRQSAHDDGMSRRVTLLFVEPASEAFKDPACSRIIGYFVAVKQNLVPDLNPSSARSARADEETAPSVTVACEKRRSHVLP